MPAPTRYAIDFGTSNSLLAAASADQVFDPVPLDPAASDPTVLRSILCFPDQGGLAVGAEALRTFQDHDGEARLLRSIKRHLGSRSFRGTVIRGRMISSEELVSTFLREMRQRADAHFGAEVRRALLGRPVHFDGEDDAFAEGRLREAARLAGFEQVDFLAEPVAAARAFGAAAEREELVLVGDFGGGTSDFTVLRIGPRAVERSDVLAVGGVAVAGDALDSSLMRAQVARHFGAEVRYRTPFGQNVLQMPHGVVSNLCSPAHLTILQRRDVAAFLADVRRWSLSREDRRRMDQLTVLVEDGLGFQLFEAIEQGKRTLSTRRSAEVRFSHPGIEVAEPVTRDGFEEASAREVERILACLDETVRAAGVTPAQITVVCCTGGTAKVPRIAAEIRRRLPSARMEQFKSFHSVVQGLAEEARTLERG
ncbi:MAG: Hsp70 family protein [Anaeromyxobacter sp.]